MSIAIRRLNTTKYKKQTIKQRLDKGGIKFAETGRTKQEFAKESDINTIAAQYITRGEDINNPFPMQQYADVAEIGDFKESMDFINEAKESFNSLDSKIRNKFKNDPAQLITFLQNPSNNQEAIELGILKSPEVTAAPPAPPAAKAATTNPIKKTDEK